MEGRECVLRNLERRNVPTVWNARCAVKLEVRDLEEYPQQEIQEVMSYCPQDCIMLSEDA